MEELKNNLNLEYGSAVYLLYDLGQVMEVFWASVSFYKLLSIICIDTFFLSYVHLVDPTPHTEQSVMAHTWSPSW